MVGYVVCFRKKLSRQQDNYVFVRSRSSGRERVMWGLLLPYGLTHFSLRHRSDLILKFSHTICLCTSLLGYAATLGDDGTFANSKTNQFAFVQACYRGDNIPLETRQWMIGAVGFCFRSPTKRYPNIASSFRISHATGSSWVRCPTAEEMNTRDTVPWQYLQFKLSQ